MRKLDWRLIAAAAVLCIMGIILYGAMIVVGYLVVKALAQGDARLLVAAGLGMTAWVVLFYLTRWGPLEVLARRKCRAAGQYMAWSEVEPILKSGRGSVVYNFTGHGVLGRPWGTIWFGMGGSNVWLTNCPLRYWSRKRLLRDFPNVRIQNGFGF